jgi:7-keto-8-aminopelargonate synthetase-like enzyme
MNSAKVTTTVKGPASGRIRLDGRSVVNFMGCGYLALSELDELRQAAGAALDQGCAFACQIASSYGLVDPYVEHLESVAATYCCSEDAVYMPTGYFIGVATLKCVKLSRATIFIDEASHYNLFDAANLSGRPVVKFRHCDPQALKQTIRDALPSGDTPIIVADAASAIDGELSPLAEYADVLEKYGGKMVLDESHSFGILGSQGRGACEHFGVDSIAVTAGTLSKAFGAHGAVIGCSREQAAVLRSSPPLRGANAGSPISAAVATAAIKYVIAHPDLRARLRSLTAGLRAKLRAIGIETGNSPMPIVAFRYGDRDQMNALQQHFGARGINLMVCDYVGAGPQGVFRCAVFVDHTESDFDELLEAIKTFGSR